MFQPKQLTNNKGGEVTDFLCLFLELLTREQKRCLKPCCFAPNEDEDIKRMIVSSLDLFSFTKAELVAQTNNRSVHQEDQPG